MWRQANGILLMRCPRIFGAFEGRQIGQELPKHCGTPLCSFGFRLFVSIASSSCLLFLVTDLVLYEWTVLLYNSWHVTPFSGM
ncbi:hypothetical protein WI82_11040 [Burkholderia ubonensis]|nr:hypothetical protein WI82_11040 [Burkholderia ubonensis]